MDQFILDDTRGQEIMVCSSLITHSFMCGSQQMKCGLYYYGQLADRTTHDIKSFIFVPFLCCFVLTDAITSGRTIQCLSGDQLAEMLTFIFFRPVLQTVGQSWRRREWTAWWDQFCNTFCCQRLNFELYYVDRLCWEWATQCCRCGRGRWRSCRSSTWHNSSIFAVNFFWK